MDVYKRLEELGLTLPEPEGAGGSYVPLRYFGGNLAYMSGISCEDETGGKLGREFTVEQGYQKSREAGLMALSVLHRELGDLNRIKAVVKVLGFINDAPGFGEHPAVLNGFSELLVEVLGDVGKHARSAIGVSGLWHDIPVEMEMLIELND